MFRFSLLSAFPLALVAPAAAQQAGQAAKLDEIEIVLSAPPAAQSPALSQPRIGSVSTDDARAQGAASLGEALAGEPGVAQTGYAPGASRPILRGLDAARVRIQENGLTTGDVSTLGDDHAVPVGPLATEKIEILRGPAALRYGSQIVGGIVEASDDKIAEKIDPGVRFRSFGALSSADAGRDSAADLNAAHGQVAVHAGWFGRAAGDYRTPDGVQANSAARARGVSLGGAYVFDQGFVGASVSQFSSAYRIPGFFPALNGIRIELDQIKFASRGEYRPSGGFIEAIRYWAGYSDYRHDEKGRDSTGLDGVRATFKNREWETRVEARHAPLDTPFGTLSGHVGAQIGLARLGSAGEAGGLIAPASTRTLALYAFERLAFSSVTRAEVGARIEHVRIAGTPALFAGLTPPGDPLPYAAARAFAPFSASLSLAHDFAPGLTGALTATYAERAPQALELFARGAHDAAGTFEMGDPNLRKEIARTIEASLRKSDGRLRFDLRGYATAYSGFIHRRDTGVFCGDAFDTCGIESELRQTIFAQKAATFLGGEARIAYDLAEIGGGWLTGEGQYDVVRARFADGTNAPRIPPHRLGAGLAWRDSNWLARATLVHAFRHSATAPGETATAGYNLLNAELRYRRALDPNRFGFREVAFGLVASNLLNARIRNSASFRKDESLAPGRALRMSAQLRF